MAAAAGAKRITSAPKSLMQAPGAAAGRANHVGGFKMALDSDDASRYVISLAPTDRALCKVDGTPIARGTLRWTVYKVSDLFSIYENGSAPANLYLSKSLNSNSINLNFFKFN